MCTEAKEFTEKFNIDQYMRVRSARQESGLPIYDSTKLHHHHLVGRQLRNKLTDEVFNVEEAHKIWLRGHYISLLLENDSSHCQVNFLDVDCHEPIILNQIEINQDLYEVL